LRFRQYRRTAKITRPICAHQYCLLASEVTKGKHGPVSFKQREIGIEENGPKLGYVLLSLKWRRRVLRKIGTPVPRVLPSISPALCMTSKEPSSLAGLSCKAAWFLHFVLDLADCKLTGLRDGLGRVCEVIFQNREGTWVPDSTEGFGRLEKRFDDISGDAQALAPS